MTISGITSAASVSPYQSANPQNNVRAQINQLFQDVQSGNLSAAQSDYASLAQLFGPSASSSTSSSSSSGSSSQSSPFAQLLSQIGNSLQSGDISGAQSALSTFQSQAQGAGAAGGHHHHHHDGGASANSQSDQDDPLLQLFQAVQTGDLSGAQQAYATLTGTNSNSTDSVSSLFGVSGTSSSSGSSSSSSTSNSIDAAFTSASSPNNLFTQLLAELGSALNNNDIATAQQDLTSFAQTVKPGSAVSVTA